MSHIIKNVQQVTEDNLLNNDTVMEEYFDILKFSVLISVYLQEKPEYLKQSLDSIIGQSLMPSEIIVVEDGPLTADLSNVLDDYQMSTSLIHRLKLKNNQGLGIALNAGLRACSYELVARMDADDISHPDRFEKQVKVFFNNPKLGIVGASVAEYDDKMINQISNRITPEYHEDINNMIPKRSPFNHNVVMYKKSLVLGSGGYEDCPSFEDYYLWCRMSRNKVRFYNIQENLLDMRTGSAISKRRGGIQYLKNIINFQKRILSLEIISQKRFAQNIAIRGCVALMPSILRVVFYKNILRPKFDKVTKDA